jgi:RNA polymerase sigma factor (sigma-70 family)
MYRKLEPKAELSRGQFDAARLAFFQLLRRKRMSPQFMERHAEDLFAQACFEYSRRVSEGIEIGNAPAWIVTCGWHRTVGLLESRDWRPRLVSTESIAEPVDGDAGPEETFLDEDRQRKVRDAVEQLPLYQRQLLALSYFEGESIREAARRLRWTASKAQRAHEAAQKRIFEILGVESTDELQVEIGLFAFLSVAAAHASGHLVPAGFEAVLDSAHRGAAELGDKASRLMHVSPQFPSGNPGRSLEKMTLVTSGRANAGRGPIKKIGDLGRRLLAGGAGEAGAAASGEGASRALEVCKGLAICALGGGAITGALVSGGHHPSRPVAHRAPPPKVVKYQHRQHPAPPQQAPVHPEVVLPTGPAPRHTDSTVHRPSAPRAATERQAPVEKTPHIERAAPAADTEAAHRELQEADVEERFGDFDATEGGGSESGGSSTGAVTESNSTSGTSGTSSTSGTSGGEASPKVRAEEAGAAKEFHGLLE